MPEKWIKLSSYEITSDFVAINSEGVAVINKEHVENLLLKKLETFLPGRYIVRDSYWGKSKSTIRFAKHNPCARQWKFTTASEMLHQGKASFDLYRNDGVCTHEEPAFARPLPIKGLWIYEIRPFFFVLISVQR